MIKNISDIAYLKTFKPVIDFQVKNEDEYNRLVDDYIVTEELADNLEDILESLTLTKSPLRRERGEDFDSTKVMRSFLVRGAYGTGKSYFLLMLSAILESIRKGEIDQTLNKFRGFDGVLYQIQQLGKKNINYFVVKINGVIETRRDFEEAIMYNFVRTCKDRFEDYTPDSIYDNAVEKLLEDKKSTRWALIETELQKMDLKFNTLISALRKYDAIALQQYEELLARAYNVDVNLYDVSFSKFIQEGTEYIKTKGYTGIAFIFDEYSAYLTARKEDGKINTNISQTQQLAEAAELSANNNILFVAATHKSLTGILSSSTVEKEDIDKIVERFEEIHIQYSSGDELIENVLSIDTRSYKRMLDKYPEVTEYAEQATDNKLGRFYPMHPKTVEYLMRISEHFAQENRTLFRFMADVVDKKIKTEHIIKNDVLNLVTPDSLYSYFIEGVGQTNIELIKSSQMVFEYCKTEWQRKVIEILIVARMSIFVASSDSSVKYGLSAKEISDFLLIRDSKMVKAFLDELSSKQSVNIYYDDTLDTYTFYESGSSKIDIEKLIDEELKKINSYDVLKDTILKNSSMFIRRKHDIRNDIGVTPVERSLATEMYSVQQIENKLKNKDRFRFDADGAIVYVIPDFNELKRIDMYIIKRYMNEYPDNIAIAIPKKGVFNFNEDMLKRHRAMQILFSSGKLDETSKTYLRNEIRKSQRLIADIVKEFDNIHKFTLVFSKQLVQDDFSSTEELYKFILDRYYYKFPEINLLKSQGINKRNTTNDLIENFIKDGVATIPNPPKREPHRHIASTMKSLDLVQVKKKAGQEQTAVLKVPEEKFNPISTEIFNIIISPDQTLQEKFVILEQAPYGLPYYMIELYVSVAIGLGKVRLTYNNKLVSNSSTNINNMRKDGYKLEIIEDDYKLEDLNYAKEMWEIIGRTLGNLNYKHFDPLSNLDNTYVTSHLLDLGADVDLLANKLETSISYMKEKGLQTKKLERLTKNLKEANKELRPEKFVALFICIPQEVFGEKDKEIAIQKFKEFMENYRKVDKNIKRINNVLLFYEKVERDKKRFEGFYEIEMEFQRAEKLKEKFVKFPYKLELLDKIEMDIESCISKFNEEYQNKHEAMYKYFEEQKASADKIEENDIIEMLEKIDFNKTGLYSIKKLKEVNYKLANDYEKCTVNLETQSSKELLDCACMREDSSLADFAKVTEKFKEELNTCIRTTKGLMDTYTKAFAGLDRLAKDKNKKDLLEYIESKYPHFAQTYIDFMQKLNDNPIAYKNELITDIEKLTDVTNQYIEYLNIISITGDKDTISISELNNKITTNIRHTGKSKITPVEYIQKIRETIDVLGDVFIEIE